MTRFFHLTAYLLRDSLLRWRGRPLSPISRLLVALCLSTATLLVLASFALGKTALEERILKFGLNTVVLRTQLPRAENPIPASHDISRYGETLNLKVTYSSAQISLGGNAIIGLAHDHTLRELADWGVDVDRLPLLLTSSLPAGIIVTTSNGPWQVEARTTAAPRELKSAGIADLLIARQHDFPMQAQTAGQAITILRVDPTLYSIDAIVHALQEVARADQPERHASRMVESALPLLHELREVQSSWARYASLLGVVLALTIAVVFGASAILEYEITAFTTALLRSFGASRIALWLQRCAESLILVNIGWAAALLCAHGIAQAVLPQLTTFLTDAHTLFPLIAALNGGALLAGIPIALAMRRQVGIILQ